jgi:hypothetical protein
MRRPLKGISILETIVYVGLFSAVSLIAVSSLFQTIKAFNDLRISRDIDDSAVQIMERITRDIKSARSVDLTNSTFGSSPGRLTLNTVNASGTPMTVEFYVSGTQIYVKENNVEIGSLMSSKTKIDALVFYYINTGKTYGVKTELRVSSSRSSTRDSDPFYDTSMMRGSY